MSKITTQVEVCVDLMTEHFQCVTIQFYIQIKEEQID